MSASESIRCPHCDRILDSPITLTAGACCTPGDWKHGDIILNPATGGLLRGEYDRYSHRVEWVEMVPIGQAYPGTPAGAVLLVRRVDGKPLPVTDLGNGELYSVRPVA